MISAPETQEIVIPAKYTNTIKNYVCRYYNYIVVNKLMDKYDERQAIYMATAAFNGCANMGANFYDTWLRELPIIKKIYEDREVFTSEHNYTQTDKHSGNIFHYKKITTYKGYHGGDFLQTSTVEELVSFIPFTPFKKR